MQIVLFSLKIHFFLSSKWCCMLIKSWKDDWRRNKNCFCKFLVNFDFFYLWHITKKKLKLLCNINKVMFIFFKYPIFHAWVLLGRKKYLGAIWNFKTRDGIIVIFLFTLALMKVEVDYKPFWLISYHAKMYKHL